MSDRLLVGLGVVVIVAIWGTIFYSKYTKVHNAQMCLDHGYAPTVNNIWYCSKVENGNTIVVHVDSLR